MKRLLACSAALLLTTSLAACGEKADDDAPAAQPPASAASTTYTMADVKKHADPSSCWTVIDGKVYDVTQWIGQHPGGPNRIEALCGNDATGAFNGQHSNDTTPHKRLASFQIGVLGS